MHTLNACEDFIEDILNHVCRFHFKKKIQTSLSFTFCTYFIFNELHLSYNALQTINNKILKAVLREKSYEIFIENSINKRCVSKITFIKIFL